MKIRFNKNHLDYKEGGEYEVLDPTAVYLVRLQVAKEVVAKDGKTPTVKKSKAPAKPKAPKAPKIKLEKAPVTTKELKTDIETK
jgi:hypothetical protein